MSFHAFAQTSESSKLEYSIHYFIDSTNDISIDQILQDEVQQTFDANKLESPNFGFDKSTYWFRVDISQTSQETLMLEVSQPSLDYISFFTQGINGNWIEQKTGHALSPYSKTVGGAEFSLAISPDLAQSSIYIKISTSGTMAVPILIKPLSEYGNYKTARVLLLGLFFGLMFVMAIYNFMLYLSLKDRAYLLYVGTTVFGLATSIVLNGYGYVYFWPSNPQMDSHIYLTFAGLSMACSSRFAATFLNLKKFDPKLDKYLWVVAGASLLMSILSVFYNATELLMYGRILVLIAFPSYIAIGTRAYLRGYKTAQFYIIAWFPYILGLVVVTLRGAGLMPEYWFTTYGIELGGSLEAVLLSFALAARIKGMRKEIAEKELEKEQFKTRLLGEQRIVLEKKVEERTQELQDANATKDKFFSIIAHDLRSPMIALQGVGQKLEYFIRKDKQEKLLEMGAKIDQSIDQLNHLLNNLLNWATSQTGGVPHHPSKLDLDVLVKENIELYRSLAESKDINVVCEISVKYAYADINTTSTIIRNLLSNALKFTGDEGEIRISTQQNEGMVEIEIEDQGMGMDEQTLSQLFRESVKGELGQRGEKGFGLGLKLCKEFTQMNRGQISVTSKLNIGTTFTVALPKA
ncbi:sensor histidine kinase [Roseivirga echinicomitans]|uniref:histidine kinase n=1 Tax=Roseivirga echinicomitans TaxID=296218 RepID=A0A150XNC1_9BACT|nr:sensor histidine kinase [Roseivirga echinicomitans]KYG80204.1 hypothetical protein AWN68_17015 [Roseivirga echinicomitans]